MASEHIFRWRFTARLIRWLVDPIARLKSRTAADTAMAIIRRLRGGANVCLFAEGNRSWNGVTCPIHPSTGRLARSCGATLVTYRLEGGYFTNPRWSHSRLRRGRMKGHVVGVYPRETLLAMSPEEVGELIVRDLYENAWERQQVERVAYKGRDLAQHSKRFCASAPLRPSGFAEKGAGDYLRCACGLQLRFTEYGDFEGEQVPSTTPGLGRLADGEAPCSLEQRGQRADFQRRRNPSLGGAPGYRSQISAWDSSAFTETGSNGTTWYFRCLKLTGSICWKT